MPTHIARTNAHDWNPSAQPALRKINPVSGEASKKPFTVTVTCEQQPKQREVAA